MATSLIPISVVNSLSDEDFIEKFANVVENCPLVAASVWSRRHFRDVNHLHDEICDIIDGLPTLAKQGILRVYPDLAGRLADHGTLSAESTNEHRAAQLDCLTAEEKIKLKESNRKYREKFSFPFVICARLNNKDAILRGIEERFTNSADMELNTAIGSEKDLLPEASEPR